MSERPSANQKATNCFAGAIAKLMKDEKYKATISYLAQISQLIVKVDSQVPGAADALLTAILANANGM